MRILKQGARAPAVVAAALAAFCVMAAGGDTAHAQSAVLRQTTAGYLAGTVASYANGRLTVVTESGSVLRALLTPRTKIALLEPAKFADIEEGVYIASAGLEKDSDTVEALEIRIVEARMSGVGEGYRPFYGIDDDEATMTNARVVGITTTEVPPTIQVRIRGRDKTIVLPEDAPIMFQTVGDPSILQPGAPVSLLTVRKRNGKTDVIRVTVGLDGIQPPF